MAEISKKSNPLTLEDEVYESLGITYNYGGGLGSPSRLKGRILIVVILALGYLAYKKTR
jgi:hypothetical protein